MRRSLSLLETTLGGIGIILGAGIYALVGAVANEAGNGLWLSFLIAASMAAAIGLCYAELASMFPKSGADYEYTLQALGRRPAFVVGWLMVIGNIIAAAAVALGFGGYLRTFVDADATLIALIALSVATLVSFAGIEQAIWLSVVGTVVELTGLVLVIAVGVPHFGDAHLLDLNHGLGGVLSGASLVMFAYLGFSQIATLAEESEDAPRVIPKAVLISIGVTTLLYVLVAVAAISVLGWQALGASEAPLADVAAEALGGKALDIVAIIALFSTANTMLLLLVAASRLIYGMASRQALPRFLAWVHPGLQTPVRAILLSLVLAGAFTLPGEITLVAGATNFAVFAGFAAVCLSLIVLRRTQPGHPRPFRLAGSVRGIPVLPVAGLVLTAVLTASLEPQVLLLGLGLFLAGLVGMELLSLWKPQDENMDAGD